MTHAEFEELLQYALSKIGVTRDLVSLQFLPGEISIALRTTLYEDELRRFEALLRENVAIALNTLVTAEHVKKRANQLALVFRPGIKVLKPHYTEVEITIGDIKVTADSIERVPF